MLQVTDTIRRYPARALFVAYLLFIFIGALVLMLPLSRAKGVAPISGLDAIFTATSATCVTGLVVRSTGHDFSLFGQLVILALMQLGGIGILTVTTFVVFGWGGRHSLRQRAVITQTLGASSDYNLIEVLRLVVGVTLCVEGLGFVGLSLRNLMDQPLSTALWHALFHSVSAFCNAGFALFDTSLTAYQGDVLVHIMIGGLIVIGGLGFPVILDIQRQRTVPRRDRWRRLHLHSKLMLIGTAGLLTVGALSFLVLEGRGALRDFALGQRVLVSFFHSVTARTAGFHTIEVGALTNATLFVTILLMVIGAGPCSTAGGFKVSTLMTLLARVWCTVRGHPHVHVYRRTVPDAAIHRAITVALGYTVVSISGLTVLLVFEQSMEPHPQSPALFLDAMFEVVSALGTVGLSTGLTPHLTDAGRVIIMLLMLIGRLGPVSVVVALSHRARSEAIELPQEEPLIG